LASLSARGVARCQDFVRRVFGALRQAHHRKTARDAERLLEISAELKLTDETERKIMESLTPKKNFQP
jgi:hypothetical protein